MLRAHAEQYPGRIDRQCGSLVPAQPEGPIHPDVRVRIVSGSSRVVLSGRRQTIGWPNWGCGTFGNMD